MIIDGEPLMITGYSSEDSGGASFNNRRIVPVEDAPVINGRNGALPPEGSTSVILSKSYGAAKDPDRINIFSKAKLEALGEEEWMRLSEPYDYSGITFETETYRSGKKHVKKTRYKENPYGKIVGKHDGAQFYTIGQRKGLNIGGHKDSIFVISTDIERNLIYVGEGHSHKGLSRSCIRIAPEDIHWIRTDLEMKDGEVRRYRVRVRYRQPLQEAWAIKRKNGLFFLFDMPQRGISSGQFAVWYSPDDEMIGSGVY